MSLRILMLTHTYWNPNQGVSRVQIELAEELRALGNTVEKYSYEDAFPEMARTRDESPAARFADLLRLNRSFPRRAARFLRREAGRFDVVDANQTALPFAKEQVGFAGLTVARSYGLHSEYRRFDRWARRRWPRRRSARDLAVAVLTLPATLAAPRNAGRSLRHADLINVPSSDELRILEGRPGFRGKVVHLALGLSAARREALRRAALAPAARSAARTVAFIGTWNDRKGARDWPAIVAAVRKHLPDTRFRFLGGNVADSVVLASFPPASRDAIEARAFFRTEELPELLRDATVGAFPGYLEAFGLGVLEMLAAGLPVVAYDAPGPRDVLRDRRTAAPVAAGDSDGFAAELVRVLSLTPRQYGEAAAEADRLAQAFRWSDIARRTAEVYAARLERLPSERR